MLAMPHAGPALGAIHIPCELMPDLKNRKKFEPTSTAAPAGIPASRTDRSTEEACMGQVPGTARLGSGHCVGTLGLASQASGMCPNSFSRASPSVALQNERHRADRAVHNYGREIGIIPPGVT